jgi:hypothetical protein
MALQQRSWLLHWALFVFFNKEGGLDSLLDFLLRERSVRVARCGGWCGGGGGGGADSRLYFCTVAAPCGACVCVRFMLCCSSNRNALQANCPWLIRYVVVAFILRRRPVGPAILSLIKEEAYRDPVRELRGWTGGGWQRAVGAHVNPVPAPQCSTRPALHGPGLHCPNSTHPPLHAVAALRLACPVLC